MHEDSLQDRIDRTLSVLDALSALLASAKDMHIVPSDGMAAMVDLIREYLAAHNPAKL